MKRVWVKSFFQLLLAFVVLSVNVSPIMAADADTDAQKEIEKQKLQKKINELKTKEKVEINKLTQTQQTLEKTKKTIKTYENQLWKSRVNMSRLESRLNSLEREHDKLAQSAGQRVREIYKGERLSLLHVIFSTKDISAFFDRLYYQKSMLKNDMELMQQLRQKSEDIIRSRRDFEYEKRNIASTLNTMNRKKQRLSYAAQTSEYLIERLRTDRLAYEQAQKELESLSRDIEKDIAGRISTETIDSNFIRPVIGWISSPFGWRRHPIFNSTRFHSGVDIAGKNLSPIKASHSGKVIHSGWYGGYGKVVIINHGTLQDGKYAGRKASTLYAHMSSTIVSIGNYVKKGDVVGYEGSTGYSTGPHLHFEVRIDGKPVNPMEFISQ